MKKNGHTIRKQGKVDEQELRRFLAKRGQFLLPMVNLIGQCQLACGKLIDARGRAAAGQAAPGRGDCFAAANRARHF